MKRQKDEEGGQEWLNTYADMITLVLTFFVLLYSISNVNISKLEEIASAMQRQLGIESQRMLGLSKQFFCRQMKRCCPANLIR